MSSGVRQADSPEKRLVATMLGLADVYTQELKASPGTYSTRALAGPELATPTGNFLNKAGDYMLGPFGNDSKSVIIADGEINVSRAAVHGYAPYLYVGHETDADDDLVTIHPGSGSLPNRELWIQAGNTEHNLTLKHATDDNGGNISCPGGEDLELAPGTVVKLIHTIVGDLDSPANPLWVVVASSAGVGGGGGTSDVDSLDDLSDVELGPMGDLDQNQLLAYDRETQKWTPIGTGTAFEAYTYGNTEVGHYLDGLSAVAWGAFDNFNGALGEWWNAGTGAIAWLRGLSGTVRTAIDRLASWLGSASNVATSIVSAVTTSISTVATSAWNWLVGSSGPAVTRWINTISTAARGALDRLASWLGTATNVGTAIVNAVTSAASTVATSVWNWLVGSSGPAVTRWVGSLGTTVRTALDRLAAWLGSASNVGTAIVDAVTSGISWFSSTVLTTATSIWNALVGSTGPAVTRWIGTLTTTARTALTRVAAWWGTAADGAAALGSAISDWWNAQTGNIQWLRNLATSATGILGAIGGAGFTLTPPAGSGSSATPGDLNMNTYDITDIDRLFFNSNDGPNEDDTRPHISGFDETSSIRPIIFQVPDGLYPVTNDAGETEDVLFASDYRFKTGDRQPVTISFDGISADELILRRDPDDGIASTFGSIGEMAVIGDDVKVRTGSRVLNLSTLEYEVANPVKIKVYEYSPSGSFSPPVLVNSSTLNTQFGSGDGSVGLLVPSTFNPTNSGTTGIQRAWLVWKADDQWQGHHFDYAIPTSSSAGSRYGSLTYELGSYPRVGFVASNADPPSGVFPNGRAGTWGVIYRDGTGGNADRSFLVLMHSENERTFEINAYTFSGDGTASGDRNTRLPDLPFVSVTPTSADAADDVFGPNDGSCGMSRSGSVNYFWAKLDGYWCRMAV